MYASTPSILYRHRITGPPNRHLNYVRTFDKYGRMMYCKWPDDVYAIIQPFLEEVVERVSI